MFFEPLPASEEAEARQWPRPPAWSGPPELEIGTIVPLSLLVARSANVAVVVPAIRVFSTGAVLAVEVVARQDGLPDADWWDLHLSMFPMIRTVGARGGLPDKLLRCGVRFAGGAKATTIGQGSEWRRHGERDSDEPPDGPFLLWTPHGTGTRHGMGGEMADCEFGLWLWPLPPAEPFEFAVEWPYAGIDLTFAELDGTAIVAAARRPRLYWD